MVFSFICSYLKNLFVVFFSSFSFILSSGASACNLLRMGNKAGQPLRAAVQNRGHVALPSHSGHLDRVAETMAFNHLQKPVRIQFLAAICPAHQRLHRFQGLLVSSQGNSEFILSPIY